MTQPSGEDLPPPPILKTWGRVYTLVVLELAALVAIFYALTRWAS